ncbi:MAG TPA: ATP-binding protein [Thermoanaerobaculia bacterium]
MTGETERVNILLVDDQPANLLALESILEEMGQNLVRAGSGQRALKELLDREFAVILLDVQMPNLNGFETASLIRQRERSKDTPIIFLTALSRSETSVFRGYELGAVDYIFKPFHPEILRSKVNVSVQLFRQRERLKRQTRDLARLSKQNELILTAAAEGIVGIDLEGSVTFVNPAAARMLGREPEPVVHKELHAILHPVFPGVMTCDRESCGLRAALHYDFSRECSEATFFRDDGSSFPAELTPSPIHNDEGETVGAVVTFRDVTEKRIAAAAEEAERRYREAEAQNRAKDNFLATLSHELRTPMTSILGWVQFLRYGGFSESELNEALATIETSARLQATLIDDMLDVSRIVLGKFQVELRPTHLNEIVDAALTTARPAAQEREVRLVADIRTKDDDDLISADPNRMQQVVNNILSNAIKFSHSGKSVELQLDRVGTDLRLSVCDHGEGIEPTFLPHVFERLRQGEGATKRSGLGLGLAIARHIVDLHRGEIQADSEGKGLGATFTVTLPALKDARANQERSAAPAVA